MPHLLPAIKVGYALAWPPSTENGQTLLHFLTVEPPNPIQSRDRKGAVLAYRPFEFKNAIRSITRQE